MALEVLWALAGETINNNSIIKYNNNQNKNKKIFLIHQLLNAHCIGFSSLDRDGGEQKMQIPQRQKPRKPRHLAQKCLCSFLNQQLYCVDSPSQINSAEKLSCFRNATNVINSCRAILILIFFRNHYFACSQVLPLGSLVSELFLFLLCDLSFPCGYFFSTAGALVVVTV